MSNYIGGSGRAVRLAVDVVLFARPGGVLALLAVERAKEPFRGRWALPGGFVEPGERTRAAALRELDEETGVDVTGVRLRWLGRYGAPARDPRGPVISNVYYGFVGSGPAAPTATPASDARQACWLPVAEFLAPEASPAFDHRDIAGDALIRWRGCVPVLAGPAVTEGSRDVAGWQVPAGRASPAGRPVGSFARRSATGSRRSR